MLTQHVKRYNSSVNFVFVICPSVALTPRLTNDVHDGVSRYQNKLVFVFHTNWQLKSTHVQGIQGGQEDCKYGKIYNF